MKGKRRFFGIGLVLMTALSMLAPTPATSRVPLATSTKAIAAASQKSAKKSGRHGAKPVKLNRYEKRYQRVWQLVKDQYLYQDRLTDWDSWQHRYDGRLTCDAETQKAVAEMLDSLDDRYTYLRSPEETDCVNAQHEEDHVVSSRMLSNNVGYIKLETFCSNKLIKETKQALKKMSGASAYVIDVRDNKGGLVDVAFREFGLFADKGQFTAFRGRLVGDTQKADLVLTAAGNEYVHDGRIEVEPREHNLTGVKPIVILVNEGTRSAAEMFAGALRDHGRAKIIGTKTFGKGILQDITPLEDGSSVKIVTARYFLPHGEFIHRRGITPDMVVAQQGGSVELSLNVALNTLGAAMPPHM